MTRTIVCTVVASAIIAHICSIYQVSSCCLICIAQTLAHGSNTASHTGSGTAEDYPFSRSDELRNISGDIIWRTSVVTLTECYFNAYKCPACGSPLSNHNTVIWSAGARPCFALSQDDRCACMPADFSDLLRLIIHR